MNVEDITVGQAVLLLGAAAAMFEGVRRAWPFARDLVLFIVEIVGAPERNGKPAKPGLMKVIGDLSERVGDLSERVERVEESAATSASAVVAVQERVEHVSAQLDDMQTSVDEVKVAQLSKAAELTQIRQTMEEIRTASTDAAIRYDENHPNPNPGEAS